MMRSICVQTKELYLYQDSSPIIFFTEYKYNECHSSVLYLFLSNLMNDIIKVKN